MGLLGNKLKLKGLEKHGGFHDGTTGCVWYRAVFTHIPILRIRHQNPMYSTPHCFVGLVG